MILYNQFILGTMRIRYIKWEKGEKSYLMKYIINAILRHRTDQ